MTFLSIIIFMVVVALVVFGAAGALKSVTRKYEGPLDAENKQASDIEKRNQTHLHA